MSAVQVLPRLLCGGVGIVLRFSACTQQLFLQDWWSCLVGCHGVWLGLGASLPSTTSAAQPPTHTQVGVELRALADVYVSLPALLVKISCSLCKQTLYICIRRLAASSLSDLHWQHASWARFGAASLPQMLAGQACLDELTPPRIAAGSDPARYSLHLAHAIVSAVASHSSSTHRASASTPPAHSRLTQLPTQHCHSLSSHHADTATPSPQ